jgi:hypothetical protein
MPLLGIAHSVKSYRTKGQILLEMPISFFVTMITVAIALHNGFRAFQDDL